MRPQWGLWALLVGALPLFAQPAKSAPAVAPGPLGITYCQLINDPAAYNHQLVRITAFITHGFEDFAIGEPGCQSGATDTTVWLMYGGTAESNTAYCCPGEGRQGTRSEVLTIEGIRIPLVRDRVFEQFTGLLEREPDTTVRATVVGRFFSGKEQAINGKTSWKGYGHLGCCALFVIQEIEQFHSHNRQDLDYTSEAGSYEKEGCKLSGVHWQRHVSVTSSDGDAEQAIAEQKMADSGQTWAFSDAERVAVESLKPYYPNQVPALRRAKNTASRQVFRWKNGKTSVVIVVTRPYWLSFYAASNSVAWVATTIKEAECR